MIDAVCYTVYMVGNDLDVIPTAPNQRKEGVGGMAISGLGCPLLQGWVGHLTCSYGCTEQFSHCAAPPVPVSIAHSDSSTRVHCLNRILVNEWVWLKSQIRSGPRMACLSKVKICLL